MTSIERGTGAKELPKKLIEYIASWQETIETSGISLEYQKAFTEILTETVEKYKSPYGFIVGGWGGNAPLQQDIGLADTLSRRWYQILEQKNNAIVRRNEELIKEQKYGEKGSTELSDEDETLLQLCRLLSEDVWKYAKAAQTTNKYE